MKCLKCFYEWMPRVANPKKCPKCGSRIADQIKRQALGVKQS